MPSDVDISNLALAHLGDSATVASIDPPEGSAQAEHCQRFYPIARDALLELHTWGFTMRRAVLAQRTNPITEWLYCYATPANMLNALAIQDPNSADDTSVSFTGYNYGCYTPSLGGFYTPQPFVVESADDGSSVIYTNQPNAVLRHTVLVNDATKFPPLFVKALAASLASLLAGPVIKGDAGSAAAARWEVIAFGRDGKSGLFGRAVASDAGDSNTTFRERQQVAWMAGR